MIIVHRELQYNQKSGYSKRRTAMGSFRNSHSEGKDGSTTRTEFAKTRAKILKRQLLLRPLQRSVRKQFEHINEVSNT